MHVPCPWGGGSDFASSLCSVSLEEQWETLASILAWILNKSRLSKSTSALDPGSSAAPVPVGHWRGSVSSG